MKKIHLFVLFAIFSVFGAVAPVFAIDEYVTVIYRNVDVAFINKSEKELDGILSSSNEDRNYYLIENYAMKKIRRLVIAEDYDFASQATLVVIDNNLDNMEAVELYSTISSALTKQQEQKEQLAKKQEAEQAKYQAEVQRQKEQVSKQYVTAQTEDGKTVYVRGKKEEYTAMFWDFRFGMFDGLFVKEVDSDYDSLRYGISGEFTYEYAFDFLFIGFDVGGSMSIVPFTNSDGTMLGDVSFVPKFGFTKLSKLQFRAGFTSIINLEAMKKKKDSPETTLYETLYSPVFGLGLNHIPLGSASFSMYADYLLGHLAYDDINFALNGGLNIAVPVFTMDRVKVNFNVGLKETLYSKESGMESRTRLILGIGAGNVIK